MPEAKFADLHLHTYYSDGTFSPQELMHRALESGISCISINDHDTVSALVPAFSQRPEDLELIPGIEVSCDWQDKEVHLLGYYIDYENKELLSKLEEIGKQRIERIRIMVDRLKQMKVDIPVEEVFGLAKYGTVGRLHLARVLLKRNIVSNIREAFIRFIGEGCPAYVSRFRMSVKEAIEMIANYGGIPVLAHPFTVGGDDFIEGLVPFGLKGIEVYYPEHSRGQVEHYKALSEHLGLVTTGGSDCHGEVKKNIKVGLVRIPYEIVNRLKKIKEAL
ncbi:MAG: PHP domain-containing protein [Candidatus Omnitrophota bacterium]